MVIFILSLASSKFLPIWHPEIPVPIPCTPFATPLHWRPKYFMRNKPNLPAARSVTITRFWRFSTGWQSVPGACMLGQGTSTENKRQPGNSTPTVYRLELVNERRSFAPNLKESKGDYRGDIMLYYLVKSCRAATNITRIFKESTWDTINSVLRFDIVQDKILSLMNGCPGSPH